MRRKIVFVLIFAAIFIVVGAVINNSASAAEQQSQVQCSLVLSTTNKVHMEFESSGAIPNATILLAAYSETGKYHSCDIRKVDLVAGKNEVDIHGTDASRTYKVFMMKDWTPLCDAKESAPAFTVQFKDYDGTVLSEQLVKSGASAIPPQNPSRSGYIFSGWSGDYTNVRADSVLIAWYKADDSPVITVGSVEASPGDSEVTVKVQIRNNPGILGMTLKVSYNAKAIELTNSENGAATSKLVYTKPGNYKDECVFTWYAEKINAADVADGEVLTLTFRIPDTTPIGTYPIEFSFTDGDVFDGGLKNVSLKIENGSIQVK